MIQIRLGTYFWIVPWYDDVAALELCVRERRRQWLTEGDGWAWLVHERDLSSGVAFVLIQILQGMLKRYLRLQGALVLSRFWAGEVVP